MIPGVENIARFFIENMPTLREFTIGGPLGFAWAIGALSIAVVLKSRFGWKTGYTRKLFHFTIFGTVAILHYLLGTRAVCLFGAMTSAVVFLAVLLGSGNILYEAMAREKDEPHRTWYILVPYFATFVGGVASNILFSTGAIAGYLVCGVGDAIGEPVGTMFGKHKYRVPSLASVVSFRSIEGSAAILLTSWMSVCAVIMLSAPLISKMDVCLVALVIAAVSTFIEAVSPHGWDNATMQIVPAFLVGLVV
jgi:phytol kinase